MEILDEINQRFSCRDFTEEEVSQKQIDRILEAGRLAPSDRNRQAWRFIAVTKEDTKKKILDACMGFEGKPSTIIALGTTKIDYKMPNGYHSHAFELGLVSGFMSLQATKEGLGSCIMGTYEEKEVSKILTVPYMMQVPLMVFVGYTKEPAEKSKNRFSKDRICSYEHW